MYQLMFSTAGYSSTGNVMSESSDVIITPPMSYPDLGAFLSQSFNSAMQRVQYWTLMDDLENEGTVMQDWTMSWVRFNVPLNTL